MILGTEIRKGPVSGAVFPDLAHVEIAPCRETPLTVALCRGQQKQLTIAAPSR
jgi:hypothetical protein